MSASTSVTFEEGYRRLQEIADRLGGDEVPVHEMCELFAEGKGLEQALGGYLAEQKARIEEIERGAGVQAFRIVAPASPALAAAPSVSAAPRLDDEIPF